MEDFAHEPRNTEGAVKRVRMKGVVMGVVMGVVIAVGVAVGTEVHTDIENMYTLFLFD